MNKPKPLNGYETVSELKTALVERILYLNYLKQKRGRVKISAPLPKSNNLHSK